MSGLPPTITDGTVTLTWGTAGQYYGYCTIADVAFEFANATNYTTMDASVKGQEITNAAMELQNMLDHVYQMPYAGSDAGVLLTLRDINAKLACANIIDRYMQGSVPNLSAHAVARRSWAELILKDLLDGAIHWEPPFADAVARAQLPVYNESTLAQISPTPDGTVDTEPIFVIGRSAYRSDVM